MLTFRLTLCAGHTNTSNGTQVTSSSGERQDGCGRAFLIDESWPESIKDFLMHLRELGLIFIRKRKDGFVCLFFHQMFFLFICSVFFMCVF